MLTPFDDSLHHQIPTTFDHAGTSDPRFYDRHWFAAYDPDGGGAIQTTLAMYRNMNVADGALAAIIGDSQHNVRFSRTLRPDFETRCGALSVEVRRPMEELRIGLEESNGMSADLTWTATHPPQEEMPHFERHRGRVLQDYTRFNQIGRMDGVVRAQGQELQVSNWWACRDHSWGVRPGMGLSEPHTGEKRRLDEDGFFMVFLFFSAGDFAGDLHLSYRGEQRTYLNAAIRRSDELLDVIDCEAVPNFFPGTRRVQSLQINLALPDRDLVLVCDALGSSIAMPGIGYSGGYDDRKGLGVWRGEISEGETWSVADPAVVSDESGRNWTPWHRIQPVVVTLQGESGSDSRGTGSLTAIASGSLPQYGLT